MGAHEAAIMLIVNHVKRAFIDARVLMPDGSDALTNALTRYGPISALALLLSVHHEDPYHGEQRDPIGAWAADPITVLAEAPAGYTDLTAEVSAELSANTLARSDLAVARGGPDLGPPALESRLTAAAWSVLRADDRFIHPDHAHELRERK